MFTGREDPATIPICSLELGWRGADSLPDSAGSWLHSLMLLWSLHKSAPRKLLRERGGWAAVYLRCHTDIADVPGSAQFPAE